MAIRRVVPNLYGPRQAEARAFYVDALGFELAMDLGSIATLASPANPTAQLSVAEAEGHDATPAVSIEVDDVDAAHARAVAQGAEIVYPLRDESWGVRRFMLVDPNGTVVNVLSHAPAASLRGPG
jgi:uncharacterized glyoxalase superfamily protein PhnB